MDSSILREYLFLSHFSTFPELKLSSLLQTFGSLNSILEAPKKKLATLGVSGSLLRQLLDAQRLAVNYSDIDKTLQWNTETNHALICYEDSRYPRLLKEIDHAPPLLYVAGDTALLNSNQLAIVGSRKASRYGLDNAYRFARDSSDAKLTITSGMASGIDSQAHKGAIAGFSNTVAVLGTGIDQCYPKQNAGLKAEIEKSGAVVSELPLGSPPRAHHFPRRNRIITGLSLGVLVVEAASQSGSLISARTAMEQNREVFSVPGLISNPLSEGCHRLIKDGAKLVSNIGDVIDELPCLTSEISVSQKNQATYRNPQKRESHPGQFLANTNHEKIIDVLKTQPCLFEPLQEATSLPPSLLIECLLELEGAGNISLEAGRYTYRHR
ncbi:MAG: DNA-processing protein DprA [Pseudohongiellaceae bacterium]